MIKIKRIIGLSAFALSIIATSAYAQQTQEEYEDCLAAQHAAKVKGGFIGAGAGAIAGKAIAASNVHAEGVIIGAVVGAIAGVNIGKETVYCQSPHDYTQHMGRAHGDNYNGNNYNRESNYNKSSYYNQSYPSNQKAAYEAGYRDGQASQYQPADYVPVVQYQSTYYPQNTQYAPHTIYCSEGVCN